MSRGTVDSESLCRDKSMPCAGLAAAIAAKAAASMIDLWGMMYDLHEVMQKWEAHMRHEAYITQSRSHCTIKVSLPARAHGTTGGLGAFRGRRGL